MTPLTHAILIPRSIFDSDMYTRLNGTGGMYPGPLLNATTAVTAGEMSGYDAYQLLQYILHNATGNLTYQAVDVTSYVVLANLPADVISILPWTGVSNGPTGALPQTFWEKIQAAATAMVNLLVEAGQLVYGGLVAWWSFLIDLGQAVWAWGMHVAGVVWEAAVEVVEKVGELLGSFVDWVFDLALAILDATLGVAIQALKAAFNAYSLGVLSSFLKMAEEQRTNGYVSQATLEEASHAIQQELFWVLLGISVGIYVAVLALAPFTFTLGAVIGAVALVVVTYLVQQFVLPSLQGSESGGPELTPETLLEALVGILQGWWEQETQQTDEETRNLWATVTWYIRWGGLMFGAYVWGSVLKITGVFDIPYGLLFGALALILAFQVLETTGEVAVIFSILTTVVGSLGIYFAAKFTTKSWFKLAPALQLMALAGILMGVSAATIGIANLVL